MLYRQQLAFDRPCYWLNDASNVALRKDEPQNNGLILSTLLTINAFGETWEWCAGAAWQSKVQVFIPFDNLTKNLQRILVLRTLELLKGVGEETTQHLDKHEYMLCVKRQLTQIELSAIINKRTFAKKTLRPIGQYSVISMDEAKDHGHFKD